MLTLRYLAADGSDILRPAFMDADPFTGQKSLLIVSDDVLLDKGATAAKERRKVASCTYSAFTERGQRAPLQVPDSCTRLTFEGTLKGASYRASYRPVALSYEPIALRYTGETVEGASPLLADFWGQPFAAEWAYWPFESSHQTRERWITLHMLEELPYQDDSAEAQAFAVALARTVWPKAGIRLTGRNLRYGRAETVSREMGAAPVRFPRKGRRS